MKEATSVLELVLWKKQINESKFMNQTGTGRKCKKAKLDDSGIRNRCRVNCGAEVITNMLCHIFCQHRGFGLSLSTSAVLGKGLEFCVFVDA